MAELALTDLKSALLRLEPQYIVGAFAQVFALYAYWLQLPSSSPPRAGAHSILYLQAGLGMLNGKLPYLHFWLTKPPGVYEYAALLALVTGGNRVAMQVLAAGISLGLFVGLVVLVHLITEHLTGSRLIALTTASGVLSAAMLYNVATRGVMPKLTVTFLGVFALFAYIQNRPLLSSVLAAIAASFWHVGVVFPVGVVLGFGYRYGWRSSEFKRAFGALALTTVIVLLPFLLTGTRALLPMAVQLFIVQLLFSTNTPPILSTISRLYQLFGVQLFVMFLGALGYLAAIYQSRHADLPTGAILVSGTGLWLLFVLFTLEFDGGRDALVLVGVSYLGTGLLLGILSQQVDLSSSVQAVQSFSVSPTALVLCLLLVLALTQSPLMNEMPLAAQSSEFHDPYWNGELWDSCHIMWPFGPEERWMRIFGTEWEAETCWGSDPANDLPALIEFAKQAL